MSINRRWNDRTPWKPRQEPPADACILGAFIGAVSGCFVGALVILALEFLL